MGWEGLVVKRLDSEYMCGKDRKNNAWVKLKPEYFDDMYARSRSPRLLDS